MKFTCIDAVLVFDAFHLFDQLLTLPLQIIVGSKPGSFGSIKDGQALYNRAASANKNLVVMDGASRFDMYDNPKYVEPAIEKFSEFYHKYLS